MERDTEVVGEMDPYIKFYIEGKEYSTGVRKGGGRNPVWN